MSRLNDIAARLRRAAEFMEWRGCWWSPSTLRRKEDSLYWQAALEIERLREELDRCQQQSR